MPSLVCEDAINHALRRGVAIVKFVSANEVGLTGSHQWGFYLPKSGWRTYTPYAPIKGRVDKHCLSVTWPDGRRTHSVVTWYGKETRSEYRLTRFGRGFPWLTPEVVGRLLVLIPNRRRDELSAYVFDAEDDIDEIVATLGVEPYERSGGMYHRGAAAEETESDCVNRQFRQFASELHEFPTGDEFSFQTRRTLQDCLDNFTKFDPDRALMRLYKSEYQLYRVVEGLLCREDITGPFRSVDEFIKTAATIMNRRKSRAGRSLENHLDTLLTEAQIPHEMRARIDGRPDVLIPGSDAYRDGKYPEDKLFVIGVKTTCKDRWRQVLNEARRVESKHILTIQPGISPNQLEEMRRAGVTLVVPNELHKTYPSKRDITLLKVGDLINSVKRALGLQ